MIRTLLLALFCQQFSVVLHCHCLYFFQFVLLLQYRFESFIGFVLLLQVILSLCLASELKLLHLCIQKQFLVLVQQLFLASLLLQQHLLIMLSLLLWFFAFKLLFHKFCFFWDSDFLDMVVEDLSLASQGFALLVHKRLLVLVKWIVNWLMLWLWVERWWGYWAMHVFQAWVRSDWDSWTES